MPLWKFKSLIWGVSNFLGPITFPCLIPSLYLDLRILLGVRLNLLAKVDSEAYGVVILTF